MRGAHGSRSQDASHRRSLEAIVLDDGEQIRAEEHEQANPYTRQAKHLNRGRLDTEIGYGTRERKGRSDVVEHADRLERDRLHPLNEQ